VPITISAFRVTYLERSPKSTATNSSTQNKDIKILTFREAVSSSCVRYCLSLVVEQNWRHQKGESWAEI